MILDVDAVYVFEDFGEFGHATTVIEPSIANGGHETLACLNASDGISAVTSLSCGHSSSGRARRAILSAIGEGVGVGVGVGVGGFALALAVGAGGRGCRVGIGAGRG